MFHLKSISSSLIKKNFDKFLIVSGMGWLLDLLILLVLTIFLGMNIVISNIFSAACAASFVFIIARQRIHSGQKNRLVFRLGVYLVYTAIVILIASFAMGVIKTWSATWLSVPNSVVLAKIVVTPPQLFCNFWMSRLLARFGSSGRAND